MHTVAQEPVTQSMLRITERHCSTDPAVPKQTVGVWRRTDRGCPLDYLIVETTGLADPLPVAMTFAAGDLREKVRLDSIITVIDGENFDFEINNTSVAYSQILYGDILLLNKCD